jgi:hypothetical protein
MEVLNLSSKTGGSLSLVKARRSSWILAKPTVETIEEIMSSTTDNLQPITDISVTASESMSQKEIAESIGTPDSNSTATGQPVGETETTLRQSQKPEEHHDEQIAIPKGNFIVKYREYADVVEMPVDAHEAIAMALIAAVLNRNGVRIENGAITVPMDFWLILISGRGAGRNTLLGLASPIIKKAGLQDLIRTSAWGSEQALYQNLAENPNGLYMWPELSIVLKKFAQSNFGGAKVWVTDRYDNFDVPDAVTYRKTGKKDTPPIEFGEAPRLNIIGTSSEDWMMTNLAGCGKTQPKRRCTSRSEK